MIYKGIEDIERLKYYLRKTNFKVCKNKDNTVDIDCTAWGDDTSYRLNPFDRIKIGFHNEIKVEKGPFEVNDIHKSRNMIGNHYVCSTSVCINFVPLFGSMIPLRIGVYIYMENDIYYVKFTYNKTMRKFVIDEEVRAYLEKNNNSNNVRVSFLVYDSNKSKINMFISSINK